MTFYHVTITENTQIVASIYNPNRYPPLPDPRFYSLELEHQTIILSHTMKAHVSRWAAGGYNNVGAYEQAGSTDLVVKT